MIITPGTTSQSITVQIVDDSGLAVTALVAATMPTVSYERVAEALTGITLSDLAALTSAYSSGGVKEVGGGYYRLCVPDAAFATTSKVRIIGEATGKHLIYPPIDCAYIQGDMAQAIPTSPASGSVGESLLFALNRLGRRNTAQAASSTTITLDAGASATDNIYQTHEIRIIAGTGAGQIATITGYVGSTKVATVSRPGGGGWTTNPDATSVFQVGANPLVFVGGFLYTFLTETVAGYLAAGFKKFFNVAVPTHTVASVDQSGDCFPFADRVVGRGTVGATSPGLTSFTPSALTPAGVAADQFVGRIIIFDRATTTTALRGQATDITASSAASLPLLTYTALTTAPQSGDTFGIY